MDTRLWCEEDRDYLTLRILDALSINYDAGADLRPSEHNARRLVEMGLMWAGNDDPSLIALDAAKQRIGFTLWGGFPNPLGLEYRDPVCFGVMTFVDEWARRTGVACRLRAVALERARARGYGRVVGSAYHEAGLGAALKAGFRVRAQEVEHVC